MKRLAVAQFLCETDSFAGAPTGREALAIGSLPHGREALGASNASGELGGFAALPEKLGVEVEWLGLVSATAPRGGPLADAAVASVLAELTGRLANTTVDGVLLALHGATAAVSDPDVTGLILEQVRAIVGPQVPVVATLNLHANVTCRMVHSADVLVGPHTWPTVDQANIGQRAAQAMADLLKVGGRAEVSAWKLPLITTDEARATQDGLLAHVWEHFPTAEALPGMISIGLFQASPWLDAPRLGWVFYQACFCDMPALDTWAVVRACWAARAQGSEPIRQRASEYRLVSRPLYPLDDLEELPLAAWAGDMVHPCHCAETLHDAEGEETCGGCGKCCGRASDP
jgi:microcystin degradation protein MlrC